MFIEVSIDSALPYGERLDVETTIRMTNVDDYWKDLGRLLLSYRASKESDAIQLARLKEELYSDVYKMFLVARLDVAENRKNGAGEKPNTP